MKTALWFGLFLVAAPSWAQPVRRSVELGRGAQPARSASRHGTVRARADASCESKKITSPRVGRNGRAVATLMLKI